MRAARLKAAGALELVDEPVPEPGPGESLVKVASVGLCGSDLHWFSEGGIGDAVVGRPLVLGHEFGGVAQSGPLQGQKVAVDPAIACNACERCRQGNHNLCPNVRFAGHGATDGGLREYLSWPSSLLYPVPDEFSAATVALLEPLGVALHSLDLGHLRYGGHVAVVGCGPIGLMLVQAARAAGAARVVAVEPLEQRLEAASACGAEVALAPAEADGYGPEVDVAFEVAGNDDAVRLALNLVRPGGQVVLAGIPEDDRTTFTASLARRKGVTIHLVRRMKDAYPRAIELVGRGVFDLDMLVSHRFGLDDVEEAFGVAESRQGLKTVVEVG